MLEQCQAIRRLGSAALNLCYVAAGRLDGYWATSVKTWDVAAGFLIASEAGAAIVQIDGGEFNIWNPRFVAAGNRDLLAEMQPILAIN
jgi:myo-inositol-1(or 4)-monophosphatase